MDLLIQKYMSSTGTAVAEPLSVALIQRGVKDTDVLNHWVTHASRLNTHMLVNKEVRNFTLTRSALALTTAPMDLSVCGRGAKPKAEEEIHARVEKGRIGTGTEKEDDTKERKG